MSALWRRFKRESWERLWSDLGIGYLDEDLLPILIEFFLRPKSFTMSSCSGRITVSDSTYPWSREETSIVYKKHGPVDPGEIMAVVEKPVVRRLWLNVVGPIIHVSAADMDEALSVLRIAREAGFKHSGILSINPVKGVLLELRTGVRMTQLLAVPDRKLYGSGELEVIVETANDVLMRGKERLRGLHRALRENRPGELDEEVASDPRAQGWLR